MSLKAFHLVFITVCTLFALALGVWGVRDYSDSRAAMSLVLGVGGIAATPVLLLYGRWFLRKLRNVSYI